MSEKKETVEDLHRARHSRDADRMATLEQEVSQLKLQVQKLRRGMCSCGAMQVVPADKYETVDHRSDGTLGRVQHSTSSCG
jgi:hypothetical protein